MSDSDATPVSTDPIPADSTELYTDPEWRALNDALFEHEAVGLAHMRWLAGDALMALSIVAESPDAPVNLRLVAARALRRARDRLAEAAAREAAV